ncbi:MAG TPA: nuclear transport factor 2 family protein [Candidatus Acidoferrum sp.]|nr:nuclear transport factor 2 family protein [Candidatus Acidoferrum sp.]
MNSESGRATLRVIAGLLLLLVAFFAGWLTSNRVNVGTNEAEQVRGVQSRGNATPETREAILAQLRLLRDAYLKRDVNAIDAMMTQLYANNDAVQVFGADANEWNRGYVATAKFIRNDWAQWGDVKLNVEDATVSSQGETAWVALNGRVEFSSNKRPIRVTATLARIGDKWMFEQIVFQWIDRRAGWRDLLHPGTLRLAR